MFYALDEQTIIAQCTPKGVGALALLRVSGVAAFTVVDSMAKLSGSKKITTAKSHTIAYGWVVDTKGLHIDQVLFLIMKAPKTFTGQDTVEITCHNNPFIIEQIIQQAIVHGARLAQQGEFSKRAVLNNKIDLVQAEAIKDVIHANSQTMLKQALAQVKGSLSSWVSTVEEQLIKALAFSDASFEFTDDEDITFGSEIEHIIQQVQSLVANIKKTFDQQQTIRQGVRVAIIGSVNAGKSSLFNALLNTDRAIVTEIPGTTRDTIEAGIYRNGIYCTLIDTAGLRHTDDIIEQQGIKKSFDEAQLADIILLVIDQSRTLTDAEKQVLEQLYASFSKKIVIVASKSDLPKNCLHPLLDTPSAISFSCHQKETALLVADIIENKMHQLFEQIDSPFLLNKRQFALLLSLEKELAEIQKMLQKNTVAFELISTHLTQALSHVSELTGKTISEKGLDTVFKEFCVGK